MQKTPQAEVRLGHRPQQRFRERSAGLAIPGAFLLATAAVAGLASSDAAAQLHATDVALKVEQGRIITGGVVGGAAVFPTQVFTSELGAYGVPAATFDPGFDSETGAFPGNTPVGITAQRALRKWNGQHFDQIPAERLEIIRSQTITTPVADPPSCAGPSLQLGLTTSTGRVHQHPAYRLLPGAGSPSPEPGVYLLELTAWYGPVGDGASDPFYILFLHDDPLTTLEEAADWAEVNLARPCYANCDRSTTPPVLNVDDFTCFINKFAQGDCYANCDGSTTPPVLNVDDFTCFINKFAQGCP